MQKILKLNNGMSLPTIGLGTYKSGGMDVKRAVKEAIDVGYRHFDCAWFYGNEREVGSAIRDKIKEGKIKREDIFITSKLWNNFHAKEDVIPMIRETLNEMKMDYIDCYLIHWPFGFRKDADFWPIGDGSDTYSDVDYIETWKGMEECIHKGLTKSIGVSNFNSAQIERLLQVANIKPVCNQVEVNPNINQKDLIKFCSSKDIAVVGYCPLGRSEFVGQRGFPSPTILDPKVIEIGKKYNKSAAQVVLNYLVNLGISVVPKSVTPTRIKENFEIFDFQLDENDIQYLDSCNKNQRVCPLAEFKNHPHYPFNIPF